MPRHFDHAAVIEQRMQYRKRLIARHVDLIEHGKAARLRAFDDRAGAEGHAAVAQGIRSEQSFCIHLHVKRHVPDRPTEHGCKIRREHIFACRFRPDKQQVFACQKRRECSFDHRSPFIDERHGRRLSAALQQRGLLAPFLHGRKQRLRHALLRPRRCNRCAIVMHTFLLFQTHQHPHTNIQP